MGIVVVKLPLRMIGSQNFWYVVIMHKHSIFLSIWYVSCAKCELINWENFHKGQMRSCCYSSVRGETWIGLTDRKMMGVFRWMNAEPLSYNAWSTSQNDARDSNCVVLDENLDFQRKNCSEEKNVLCSDTGKGTVFQHCQKRYLKVHTQY